MNGKYVPPADRVIRGREVTYTVSTILTNEELEYIKSTESDLKEESLKDRIIEYLVVHESAPDPEQDWIFYENIDFAKPFESKSLPGSILGPTNI
jgi:hypothetical protein